MPSLYCCQLTAVYQRTGESVNGEEALRVAAGDVVAQSSVGGVVVVERVQLDHVGAVTAALQHARVVDGPRRLWTVVVDVVDLDQHVDERAARHGRRVVRVDGQPVVGLSLTVQHLLGVDHPCTRTTHAARALSVLRFIMYRFTGGTETVQVTPLRRTLASSP